MNCLNYFEPPNNSNHDEYDSPIKIWSPQNEKIADWKVYYSRLRTHFSYNDTLLGHADRCFCERHTGAYLTEERGNIPHNTCGNGLTLQQFTTPFDIALHVAEIVSEVIKPTRAFVDLGAGNGPLSGALLLKGFEGVGLEVDQCCFHTKLKDLQCELPFGTEIPYKAIYGCIDGFKYEDADFVIMNPPYLTKSLQSFFASAFKIADIVFALVPTAKFHGKRPPLDMIRDENDCVMFPLFTYDFPLANTRQWHTHQHKTVKVDLVLCLKNKEVDVEENFFTEKKMVKDIRNIEDAVYGLLNLKENEYTAETHQPTNEECRIEGNRTYSGYLPAHLPLVKNTGIAGRRINDEPYFSIHDAIDLMQKNTAESNMYWSELETPRASIVKIIDNGIELQATYGARNGEEIVTLAAPINTQIVSCYLPQFIEECSNMCDKTRADRVLNRKGVRAKIVKVNLLNYDRACHLFTIGDHIDTIAQAEVLSATGHRDFTFESKNGKAIIADGCRDNQATAPIPPLRPTLKSKHVSARFNEQQ